MRRWACLCSQIVPLNFQSARDYVPFFHEHGDDCDCMHFQIISSHAALATMTLKKRSPCIDSFALITHGVPSSLMTSLAVQWMGDKYKSNWVQGCQACLFLCRVRLVTVHSLHLARMFGCLSRINDEQLFSQCLNAPQALLFCMSWMCRYLFTQCLENGLSHSILSVQIS